jgi:hypothetical protein
LINKNKLIFSINAGFCFIDLLGGFIKSLSAVISLETGAFHGTV